MSYQGFDSPEEHRQYEEDYGLAQSQSQDEGEYWYQQQEYMKGLLQEEMFDMYAYEFAIQVLSGLPFEKSGLGPVQYLIQQRDKHAEWLKRDDNEIPF